MDERIRTASDADTRDNHGLGSTPGLNHTNPAFRLLVSDVQTVRGMLDKSDELRDRVEARKHELLAKFNELKADTRREAAEARTRLKARLDEIELHLKNGWEKVNDDVRTRLNKWLERHD